MITASRVVDPEILAAAVRDADLDCCQVSSGPAPSILTRFSSPRMCLDLVELGPAMLFSGALGRDCYTLVFVTTCPQPGRSFNFGAEHGDGYIGLFPPGSLLDAYTPVGYAGAVLGVPVADFEAALARSQPEIPERILRSGAGMRVGQAEQARLRALLGAAGEAIRDATGSLAGAVARRALERDLLGAFLAALQSGCEAIVARPGVRVARRYDRLRRAREFIAGHPGKPVRVEDLCTELGLSERGVENLFRDLVGLRPATYLRHQRLHCVHRALLDEVHGPGAVKEAALRAGFWHLGRFAREYRSLFGELPSETLERNGCC